MQGVVALSKHVTHYGSRLGFIYYNLTTPSIVLPLSVTREAKGKGEIWLCTGKTVLCTRTGYGCDSSN